MSRQQISFKDTTSRTKQSFADETDINAIMRKYRRTGELTHLNAAKPTYGDFSDVDSYLEASNRVIAADADFQALSARIRARMHNSPAELLRFMADGDNLEEAVALGLVQKPDPPAHPAVIPQPEPKVPPLPAGDPPPVAPPTPPVAPPITGGD